MTQPPKDDPHYRALADVLRGIGPVAVAFSGGVDSTLLAAAAGDVLGADRVLLLTALSRTFSTREADESRRLAEHLGLRRVTVEINELSLPAFRENPPDRCYHCKKALFALMAAAARDAGDFTLCDGSNADDTGDYRPGRRALAELGVRSPLLEARLGKADIRRLSRAMGLPTWDRPSAACLASRFPYGTPITGDLLERVGACEDVLRDLGFNGVRVRHHGRVARIEVPPDRIADLAAPEVRSEVLRRFRARGYAYVALDLEGYRTGSLNEVLDDAARGSD